MDQRNMVAQDIERREAEARVFGTSAPPVVHKTKEQSRFAQHMEIMARMAREKLHSDDLLQTSTYFKSDAEKQAEMAQNLPGHAIPEEQTKPTPNEAWGAT